VRFHAILSEVLFGEEWLVSLSDRFTALEIKYALNRRLGWFRKLFRLCGKIEKYLSYRRSASDLTDRPSDGLVTTERATYTQNGLLQELYEAYKFVMLAKGMFLKCLHSWFTQ